MSKAYVSQTGRSFKTCCTDHRRGFTQVEVDPNYTKHLIEHNYIFNDQFKIWGIEDKSYKLNYLESLEINILKYSELLLSIQLNLNNYPLLNLMNIPSWWCHLLIIIIANIRDYNFLPLYVLLIYLPKPYYYLLLRDIWISYLIY